MHAFQLDDGEWIVRFGDESYDSREECEDAIEQFEEELEYLKNIGILVIDPDNPPTSTDN